MLRALVVLAVVSSLLAAPASALRSQAADDPSAALSAIFARVERFADLSVDAGAGVVQLGGTTASPAVREEAEQLAASLPGVLFVDNQIQIVVEEAPETEGDEDEEDSVPTSIDEQIENTLRGILKQVDELSGITVAVEAGVVHLAGESESNAATEKAVALAEGLDGVVYVDDGVEATSDITRRLLPHADELVRMARAFVIGIPLYVVALLVLAFFGWLAKSSLKWRFPETWFGERTLLREQFHRVLWLGFLVVGVFLALEIVDAAKIVGAVVGAAGLAGLAVSFAFRDIIENYLASLLLSVRRPFAVKDVVEIDGTTAKIIRMTTSETLMLTLDGNHVRIPNSHVFKSKIVNYSRNPLRRFDFVVGVGNEVDLEKAQQLGLDTIAHVSGVLGDPEPAALVEQLGDSNVSLRFYAWVDQRAADFGKVRSRAVQLVKTVFDDEGIDMPVPIQEVYLRRVGDEGAPAQGAAPTPPDAGEARRTAAAADVSTDPTLDAQIDQDNAGSHDTDLLDDEQRA